MKKKIVCSIILIAVLFCSIFATMQSPNAASPLKSTKINSCVSKKVKTVDVSWNKVSKADGYQIKIARDKNFKKVVKTINTKKQSKTQLTGFISGNTYYVKIRAFDKVKNKKVYSKWSSVKSVKVHKHNYKLKSTTKSTCTKSGVKKYKCNCGVSKSETIAKVAHKYTFKKETKATCQNNGTKTFKCNCGKTKTESIAKLGHDYKVVKEEKASCTNEGLKIFKCNCGQSKTETIKKTTHNYSEEKTDNTIVYTCLVCNYSYTKVFDKYHKVDLMNGQYCSVYGHFDDEMAEEVFKLTNEYRVANGLPPYEKGNAILNEAVHIRALEIVDKVSPTLCHTRPNGDRAITSFGSDARCCGENLGRYQKTAEDIVEGWKYSPGHNRNLLKTDAKYLSVGVFAEKETNGKYYYHFVQLFGY